MVQRYWNCIAITLDSIQDVWAPPIAWNSLGLELCGPHGDWQYCVAGWCYEWGYPDTFLNLGNRFWSIWSQRVALTSSLHVLKSSSRGALMSLWSCVDRFTTWYSRFKQCCNIVCTSYSPSQLYCSTQVSTNILTSFNVQWHLLHCKGVPQAGFSLCVVYNSQLHMCVCVHVNWTYCYIWCLIIYVCAWMHVRKK